MVKYISAFLLVFLVPLFIHASEWREIESGLSYKTIEFKQSPTPAPPYLIHVFKINPKKHSLRPILSNSTISVRSMAKNSGALLAVNANFFDPQDKPLGLIISDGKTLNPFKKISWWGVFYIENSKGHVVSSRDFKMREGMTTAIQAGPRLVIDGNIPRLKSSNSQKTAIGINKKGEIILLSTLFPISILDLAKLMSGSESKGGLGCLNALNLDGGSSSQLYAQSGEFELNLPSYIGVPAALGVFRK